VTMIELRVHRPFVVVWTFSVVVWSWSLEVFFELRMEKNGWKSIVSWKRLSWKKL
jgi:hypothetical protein